MNPEEVFGIHPAQAALLLMKLAPLPFKIVEQMAYGKPSREIAAILGVPYNSVRRRSFDAQKTLGCPAYGFARIYFAAKFLHLCPAKNGQNHG